MNDNEQIDNLKNESQNDPNQTQNVEDEKKNVENEKQNKEIEANKKTLEQAAELAAESYAPGVGKTAFNIAKNTKIGDELLNKGATLATDVKNMNFTPDVLNDSFSASDLIPNTSDGMLDFGSEKKDVESEGSLSGDASSIDAINNLPISLSTKIYIYLGVGLTLFLIMFIIVILHPSTMLNLTDGEVKPKDMPESTEIAVSNELIESSLLYLGDESISNLKNLLNNDNISYVFEDEAGYSWLSQTGLDLLKEYLETKEIKNIVTSLGINDLDKIDNYINVYNNLINESDTKLHILPIALGDIDLEKLDELGFSVADINNFNNRLQEAFPENYIYAAESVTDQKDLHNIVLERIRKSTNFNFLDQYPEEGDAETLKGSSILDVLGEDGIIELEEYIINNIESTQKCSASRVAASAVGLINGLHKVGYKIPFYPSGAYYGVDLIDRTWGSVIEPRISADGEVYNYNGLDSSGLVYWAMTTAGINSRLINYDDYILFNHSLEFNDAYPGALLLSKDYIGIVIENKKTHLEVVEAINSGGHFASYNKKEIEEKYIIAHTVTYYNENCSL